MGTKVKAEGARGDDEGKKREVGGVRRPVPDEPHARHLCDALLALAAVLAPAGGAPAIVVNSIPVPARMAGIPHIGP
jgi:hypothetical protein